MKIKTLPITLLLLCLLTVSFAFVKKANGTLSKVLVAIKSKTDSIPSEKVYLQLDKPYYALGDTLWFKGYVTIGNRHQLSALSGSLYVDLITGRDSIIRSLKLPVTSGMVIGNFIADDDVTDGNYRIRAYTRWMRNAGEEYFFDKAITIGNPALAKKATAKASNQSDVQFFPESGSLVYGILSRVAFKAVGADGLGVAIKGKVIDVMGAEVAQIETQHAGMGSFSMRPEAGKTYTAQFTLADGTTKTLALPKAAAAGYVLSVYQPNKDSILVRLMASPGLLPSEVNLVAQSVEEVIFASAIKVTGTTNSIWLDKASFPSGIAQFTIYNKNGEPLNERIAFIRGSDAMDLKLETAKSNYKSREPVKINLKAQNSDGKPTFGNFSVAVIDETKVPFDENDESTILTHLLLTADLKGYIEQPNYYFAQQTSEVNRALDNLLLTQGYRRFVWKDQAGVTKTKPQFAPEGLGVAIAGQVQTLNKKPVPNATVMLLSLKAGVNKVVTADSLGRFSFGGMFMTDSIRFTVQARGAKNSDRVKVILDSLPKAGLGNIKNRPAFVHNAAYIESLIKQGGTPAQGLTAMQYLKQVDVKSTKAIADRDITPQGMFRIPEGSADQTVTLPEAADCNTLSICLQGRLQGISIQSELGYTTIKDMRPSTQGEPTLALILDGRKVTNPDEISEILEGSVLPTDVAKVMVVRTSMAMKGLLGGPALMIITRVGAARKPAYNPSVATAAPKGFNKVREFYSPRYDKPMAANRPDLRSTIYWNPYLKTDAGGKSSFSYYNADGPGTYKVIVEGINADGELGRQVLRYAVGEGQTAAGNTMATTGDKSLAMITAPLDSFNMRLPAEKVYLQTDKPYYSIGDTLWFKAYLLDKVNLTGSKISGLLYVELHTDSSDMVRRISIAIKDGVGWGQIPLTDKIFRGGSHTLRAYTNWMQNFGEDYVFTQQVHIGVPSADTWLVRSSAALTRVADKNQLSVDIKLNRADGQSSPIALKKVEVKIFDEWHYIFKEELQTGLDGSLKLSQAIKDKADASRVRVQITSLEKDTYGKVVQIPLNINRDQKMDLQFLPEGGKLVNGLKSTVGFKAISEDGKGMAAQGGIFDGRGNEVVSFNTLHNGMGCFEFTPKAGGTYIAKILQPVTKVVALPKIYPAGTVMRVTNPEQSDNLTVALAGLDQLGADSAAYLIGTSRGVIYYSQKIEPGQTAIAVAKSLFPSGIARFTLFKGKTPLNERAVFIDNKDQLNISITPNKATYNKRDSVGLDIEVKDKSGFPVKGSFSLAVTDDTQVRPDSIGNQNIATSLLLKSDLKGYIENPGYYINRKEKQAWQALDNLLLIQGWTGYDWKDVFSSTSKSPKFTAEKEFKVTGVVTNLGKKPVPNAEILISSQKPSFLLKTLTDINGRYTFKNLPLIDSGSFFIQANNDKGKARAFGNITVEKFRARAVPPFNTLELPWYINTDSAQLNFIKQRLASRDKDLKLTGNVLKEVQIKSKKIIPESMNRNGAGNSDLAFDEADIKASSTTNLLELLEQKLPGLRITYDKLLPTLKWNNNHVVINVDGGGLPIQLGPNPTVEDLREELSKFAIAGYRGMEINYSPKNTLVYYNPQWRRTLAFMKNPAVIRSEDQLRSGDLNDADGNPYGLSSGGGWYFKAGYRAGYLEARVNVLSMDPPAFTVVEITTKNGNGWFLEESPATVTYRPLPVTRPQEFYSPKYRVISPVIEPDFRSTLFWEPNVTTDNNGKAKVSFYTSDNKGKYTIKVAGVDVGSGIGDATAKINTNTTTP
jgi:hypothetical protein